MRKEKGLAAIFVSGIIMYLFLAIAFYQSAMAEDELNPMQIGYWYKEFNSDSRTRRAHAVFVVSNSIMAASYGMAMGDPGTDEYNAGYANARSEQIRQCMNNFSHEELANTFFQWAVNLEFREDVWMGAAIALFLDTCYKVANSETES